MPLFWILIVISTITGITVTFYLKQMRMAKENIRLENMVKQRTSELAEAKEESDRLLKAILPEKIAEELKGKIADEAKGDMYSICEDFDDVTILFSDIVEFTKTSSGYKAREIVTALNELFSRFDERAVKSGIERIKTIGDSYMAACGIPTPHAQHAEKMVDFAKGMLEDLAEYNKTALIKFNIRIGMNSGPVAAGVIGKTKFIYDVWGNTVNVASRMETASSPGMIRVSQSVYEHLKDKDIGFSAPIECNVKGKGIMITYDLL